MFTCLFEGETSNIGDLYYNILKTNTYHASYSYLYEFYILKNILEEYI